MARYVDGYVLPIPKKNLKKYRRMALLGCRLWMDNGALDYRETVGEDFKGPMGLSFAKQLKIKKGETVILAYVVYKSRAHRDRVNAAVMKDPRMAQMGDMKSMPFDLKRVVYSGFETLVEA